jgi:PadR family transcriptional regulator, regulatory protein PadR
MARRLSPQSADVLRALAGDPTEWRYGYELGQQVGLRAGSLYPILMRLSERGLLDSSWESDPPPGRPARHLYRLTGVGERAAAELSSLAAATDSTGRTRGIHVREPRSAW